MRHKVSAMSFPNLFQWSDGGKAMDNQRTDVEQDPDDRIMCERGNVKLNGRGGSNRLLSSPRLARERKCPPRASDVSAKNDLPGRC